MVPDKLGNYDMGEDKRNWSLYVLDLFMTLLLDYGYPLNSSEKATTVKCLWIGGNLKVKMFQFWYQHGTTYVHIDDENKKKVLYYYIL